MKDVFRWLLPGLCAGLAACAQLSPAADPAAAAPDASERQILVMLRSSPPHFRPDADYALGYESRIRQGGQQRVAEDLARNHDLKLVTSWPMPALGVDCFVMEAQGPQVIAGLVDAMARDKRVESAQSMNTFHMLDHNDPLFPLQPGARLWHLAEVHKVTTGRNVRVAEIDTGVDIDHPDLRGRIAMSRDFVGTQEAVAGEAHGTAVAGIIAARADDGIGIAGVAPDATLLALRACQQQPGQSGATCSSFTLAKALQFALDHEVQVINLSLGGPPDRLLARLVDVGLARNIIIVAAADPRVAGGGFPAAYPGVLAVASDGDANVPAGALLAPGRDVPATTLGQSWGFVTGSSYAAAQVTGAVALLLERAPAMEVAQVRRALASNTTAVMLAQGTTVDVCSAIARTTNACVCGCVVARGGNSIIAH